MNLPLVGITLFFLSGIVAGTFFPSPLPWFFLAASLLSLLLAGLLRRSGWFLFLFGAAVVFGGAFSAQRTLYLFPANHISRFIPAGGEKVWIKGTVSEKPSFMPKFNRVQVPFEAEEIELGGARRKISGKVRLNFYRARSARQFEIGERLELETQLRLVPSEKYGAALRRQRILVEGAVWGGEKVRTLGVGKQFWFERTLSHARAFLEEKLVYGLDDSAHRQILWGLVFGTRETFSPELTQLFQHTNTYHVLAISGFNMTLVITLLTALLAAFRVPHRWLAGLMIVVILLYMALVDWPPSATRAGVMSMVGLLAWAANREALALNTIAVSALVILLVSPMQLFMPGFQLSYLVVLGLVLWSEPFQEKLQGALVKFWALLPWRRRDIPARSAPVGAIGGKAQNLTGKLGAFIQQALCVSFVAWISVLPLLLHLFGTLTPYSIVTNVVIVGFVSALTYLGIAALILNLISVNIGIYLSEVNALLMKGLLAILRFFEKLPGCYLQFPKLPTLFLILFYFIMLLALYVKMSRKPDL